MFRSLRNRNYRLFAAGSAVSNIGTWLQRVAQDWLILQLTAGSGIALGITTGLQFLPFLLIAPFGGVIADRFSKRRVLQCTQVSMGITAAALAVLDLTGVVQVWHVYLLAFLFGMASAIDNPARQSFVVEMVGRDDLPNAVGLNSASFNGARVIGPAVAGFLIVFVGTGWVILINAVTYAATIWAIAKMRPSELHTTEPVPRKPGMVRDGLRYVRGRPDLMLVLWVVFFVGCFGLNFQMTSALMATQVFGKGAGEFGMLSSIMAVGAVVGALGAARRGVPRLRTVVGAAVIFGILEIFVGLMPTYSSYAAMLPLLGFAQLTMITAANAMMQLTVVPDMRGRVISLYSMVFIGSTPLGSPIIGWIGQVFGARWTLIGGGLVSLIGTIVVGSILLRRQGLVLRAHLRPRPHMHVWSAKDFVEPAPSRATEADVVLELESEAATAEVAEVPRPDSPPGVDLSELESERRPARAGAGTTDARSLGPDSDGELDPAGEPVAVTSRADGAPSEVGVAPKRDAVSAAGEKVSSWNSPATARCARPTPHDTLAWRRRAATRRSRRTEAGPSKTS
ncbi:MFS transporter [Actinopolymorpha alba]|uniref:MFS transporter n=1 Tax=Actinopolymorpha alba TaxID=533267 RepID=UPI000A071DB7|nr:MFS transporter [Actinopolymorpha alba]